MNITRIRRRQKRERLEYEKRHKQLTSARNALRRMIGRWPKHPSSMGNKRLATEHGLIWSLAGTIYMAEFAKRWDAVNQEYRDRAAFWPA